MAKKRRAKKKKKSRKSKRSKKAKKVRRVKRVKRVKIKTKAMKFKVVGQGRQTTKQSAYTLALAGGIIMFVAGILTLFFSNVLPITIVGSFTERIISLASAVIVLVTATAIRKTPKNAAVIILVFSIVALIFKPYGFIVGPILSLIASAILLLKR